MHRTIITIIVMALYFAIPLNIHASTSSISCHCFKERKYDPKQPFKTDQYLLATAQNTFFSLAFKMSKMDVVLKKQTGTTSEELWISGFLAQISGETMDELLKSGSKGGSLNNLVNSPRYSDHPSFKKLKYRNGDYFGLAKNIVSIKLSENGLLKQQVAELLISDGANTNEMILLSLISGLSGKNPLHLFNEIRNGKKSYSEAAHSAGISPDNLRELYAKYIIQK